MNAYAIFDSIEVIAWKKFRVYWVRFSSAHMFYLHLPLDRWCRTCVEVTSDRKLLVFTAQRSFSIFIYAASVETLEINTFFLYLNQHSTHSIYNNNVYIVIIISIIWMSYEIVKMLHLRTCNTNTYPFLVFFLSSFLAMATCTRTKLLVAHIAGYWIGFSRNWKTHKFTKMLTHIISLDFCASMDHIIYDNIDSFLSSQKQIHAILII